MESGTIINLDPKELKFLGDNRFVKVKHINQLKTALSNNNLLDLKPILINKRKEILDGQHRVCAALAIGLKTVPCLIGVGGIQEAQLLNQHSQNWGMDDFAYSYAKRGNLNYAKYLEVRKASGLGVSECIQILSGSRAGDTYVNFRKGLFRVRTKDIEVQDIINKIDDFKLIIPKKGHKTRAFVLAFLVMYRLKKYDHKRMMHKCSIMPVRRQPDTVGYLEEMEYIYNYKMPKSNKLRFVDTL